MSNSKLGLLVNGTVSLGYFLNQCIDEKLLKGMIVVIVTVIVEQETHGVSID